jgi:hypothetical protein
VFASRQTPRQHSSTEAPQTAQKSPRQGAFSLLRFFEADQRNEGGVWGRDPTVLNKKIYLPQLPFSPCDPFIRYAKIPYLSTNPFRNAIRLKFLE